jgi:hypothetical protein
MKYVEISGFALIFPLALCAGGLQGQVNEVFNIGSLEAGMHKEEVIQLLGPPDRTVAGEGFFKEFLHFAGVTVSLDEDQLVTGVSSLSKNYCLYGKICPGMAWDSAIAATQGMNKASSSSGVILLIGDGCNGEIRQELGTVHSVKFDCPP